MQVVLISTYEQGRQPFGLASPAAWLRRAGHLVTCADLNCEAYPREAVQDAGMIAFFLPMHTATRLAVPHMERVKEQNPGAVLCAYGLYAPLNETYLRTLGIAHVLGGEFEPALVALAEGRAPALAVSLERLQFQVPDRTTLPPLSSYARLITGTGELPVAYTEATRGCKHLCRHCPVVPVYQGKFRVVQPEIVLSDIRQQIAAGAAHVTFGDPDFFNGPAHAVRIIQTLQREFPLVTYDVTIKIEHLRKHRHLLPLLRDTGCAWVTSAVESLDDEVLAKLNKGHTRAEFIATVGDFRNVCLTLVPTFIAFTPWTTRASYRDLLATLSDLDLIENVSPVQLALRLLITAQSGLLELPDIQNVLGPFDPASLAYQWKHPDPTMDELAAQALRVAAKPASRRESFAALWYLVHDEPVPELPGMLPRATIPYLNEPWYC